MSEADNFIFRNRKRGASRQVRASFFSVGAAGEISGRAPTVRDRGGGRFVKRPYGEIPGARRAVFFMFCLVFMEKHVIISMGKYVLEIWPKGLRINADKEETR